MQDHGTLQQSLEESVRVLSAKECALAKSEQFGARASARLQKSRKALALADERLERQAARTQQVCRHTWGFKVTVLVHDAHCRLLARDGPLQGCHGRMTSESLPCSIDMGPRWHACMIINLCPEKQHNSITCKDLKIQVICCMSIAYDWRKRRSMPS